MFYSMTNLKPHCISRVATEKWMDPRREEVARSRHGGLLILPGEGKLQRRNLCGPPRPPFSSLSTHRASRWKYYREKEQQRRNTARRKGGPRDASRDFWNKSFAGDAANRRDVFLRASTVHHFFHHLSSHPLDSPRNAVFLLGGAKRATFPPHPSLRAY